MMEPIKWLSTTETAAVLGVSSRTVYGFIDEGRLPGYRMGRVIRVMETDVARFIDGCRIEPGSMGWIAGDNFVALYEDAVATGNGTVEPEERIG